MIFCYVKRLMAIVFVTFALASGNIANAEDLLEAPQPVVVEMFLSQACEKCPMAGTYFSTLVKRHDIVALSWHVDYWDNAYAGRKGRWKDPFSDPKYSARQRQYNQNLRGRPIVFTPQVVINGSTSVIGSHHDKINAHVEKFLTPRITPSIRFEKLQNKKISVSLDNLDKEQNVFVASFYHQAETKIKGGANKGITFKNANIVDEIIPLNVTNPAIRTFTIDTPIQGMGCAVVIQKPEQGAIITAAYCPD